MSKISAVLILLGVFMLAFVSSHTKSSNVKIACFAILFLVAIYTVGDLIYSFLT